MATTPDPVQRPTFWRTLLPFVVGGALLAFVLLRLDYQAFFRHLGSIHYGVYLAFTLVFNLALVASDSLATRHVYARAICPISYRDVFVLRAASYLPSLLNYHVGQGWLTYFVSRIQGAPLWRVAGATLIIYASVMGALVSVALVGLPLNYGQLPWLLPTLSIIACAGVIYLVVVHLRPRALERGAAITALFDLGVKGHLLAIAWRLPHISVLFIGTWVSFLFFDVNIPLTHALGLIPPLMLAVSLPISPQGVGTRDVVAQQLFLVYAVGSIEERKAAVAAATLTWACAITLVQALVSPFFMRKARQLLRQAREQPRPVVLPDRSLQP